MSTQETGERLQGTLDLRILPAPIFGPRHGQGPPRAVQETSQEDLGIERGALHAALQHLEARTRGSAKWEISANNREARFCALSAAGRKQLVKKTTKGKRLLTAIAQILGSEAAEG